MENRIARVNAAAPEVDVAAVEALPGVPRGSSDSAARFDRLIAALDPLPPDSLIGSGSRGSGGRGGSAKTFKARGAETESDGGESAAARAAGLGRTKRSCS